MSLTLLITTRRLIINEKSIMAHPSYIITQELWRRQEDYQFQDKIEASLAIDSAVEFIDHQSKGVYWNQAYPHIISILTSRRDKARDEGNEEVEEAFTLALDVVTTVTAEMS